MCSNCGMEKELTRHGTCFKCHVGGLSVPKCKGCGMKIEDFRVKQNLTTSIKMTPLGE